MGKFKKKPLFTGRQKQKAEKRIRSLARKGRINQTTKNRFIDFKNKRASRGIDLANRVILSMHFSNIDCFLDKRRLAC
jgi:hypothetical protein